MVNNLLKITLVLLMSNSYAVTTISPLQFGAIGDGIADDTQSLQKAFQQCSDYGYICNIPPGYNFLIKKALFVWGAAQIQGSGGSIVFDVPEVESPYLINVGINAQAKNNKDFSNIKPVFNGVIAGVNFKIAGGIRGHLGSTGRIIYLWRTENAKIINNNFNVARFAYSATSSGNNNNWVVNGYTNCVRKNITISGNRIIAQADSDGSEGIGLQDFDGALIENNDVIGVGDDPVASHWSNNIKILNNNIASVDGRVFVVNSNNVEIGNNKINRMPSLINNNFYEGVSLIYLGFEHQRLVHDINFPAPTNIYVHNNILTYPEGSKDSNAAILVYGARNTTIENNSIINNHQKTNVHGIWLLPITLIGGNNNYQWTDPEAMDAKNIAKVYGVKVINNKNLGLKPLDIALTTSPSEVDYYVPNSKYGENLFKDNIASFYEGFDVCSKKINNINNLLSK